MKSMTRAIVVHQMRTENCLAYLIADADTHEAALVDPRADRVADYLRELEQRGLRLRLVLDTHTHADHLSGAAELHARTGADVVLSAQATSEVATRRLSDGDRVALGGHDITLLASPGHTDDSMSLLVDGALLTGDALLIGGAGRTDFQNGSPEALYETLHRRFADLPGHLIVYPGHDYAGRTHSTLGQERETNPLLRLTERDRFVAALRAGHQAKPANMDTIVAANIHGVRPTSRITVDELAGALGGAGAPLVVDVRLPAEYRSVHLEPSVSLPLDEIAARRSELPRDREIALVCRTGARARVAAAGLSGFRTRVLEGGIAAWQDAGHPVVEGQAHMSLERQVRIAAGALACTGGVLAVAVSPWFGLLPAFVGAGLVYAGITDRCGMAMLLGKLPYNRRGPDGAGGTCAAPVGTATPGAPGADAEGTCAAPLGSSRR
ncbi:MAG TPA: rhodanese-like domain-containing protein [Candidatus Acidoferrum sp.]|jgi:glyoxylase-like metal-dependent hydrolase (beta-lactamase superfamily II)/rhodanese-related sulfurtransferase|nr:rhodanese-like domain-containing protein [Candidatus Acidoferrum sp.]